MGNHITYKRKGEETAYKCGECETVFKKAWIHKEIIGGKGWNEPEILDECPFCGAEFDVECTDEIKLDEVKNRPEKRADGYDPEYQIEVGRLNRDHWWNTQREEERHRELPLWWYTTDLREQIPELDRSMSYRPGLSGFQGMWAIYQHWGIKWNEDINMSKE